MKYLLISAVMAGLVFCALSAGCTSPTQAEIRAEATSPPPTTAVPAGTISSVVSTPVQVETLPAEQYVDLQLSKERPDNSLHLLYNGGKGEAFIQNVLMKVTLSTGEVVEQYMNDNKQRPKRGDEIVIPGTRGSDRVEVFVTSAGRTYKVIDRPMLITAL